MTPTAAPRATRTVGHRRHDQRDHHGAQSRARHRRYGKPDQDRRKGQHDVDQPHDPAVGAGIVGRQDAEHAAHQPADQHADQAQHQRVACAEDDAAQDVAAGVVGAEPMLAARRPHHLGEVGEIGVVGRHRRREDGGEPDHGQGQGGEHRHLVARQPSQHARAAEHAGLLGMGGRA
jgi:hypothetical protein